MYLRVSWLAVILGTVQRQAAKATLDVEAGLIEGAVVAFCNTLIDICQMETEEWIKHLLLLSLQDPDNGSVLLDAPEHGVQLNITRVLQGEGRRTKKNTNQPTSKKKKRKSSSATKWTRPKYLLTSSEQDISF